MEHLRFTNENGGFILERPENVSYLYFPLASETGLKSCVTPNFGGDAKLDQETFLLPPVSAENLHNDRSVRNFWLALENGTVWSAVGASCEQEAARFTQAQEESELEAGFMWQTVRRISSAWGLKAEVTAFIPPDDNVEILHIMIENTGDFPRTITPYAAIPIYGRSADNIRDHRNVTSMLHRIRTTRHGVLVRPTMSFDEKGHRLNQHIYYVLGCSGKGVSPERFYPTVEDFIGEGGTYTHPRSVLERLPGLPSGSATAGREAMGAFRFPQMTLAVGETEDYILLLGVEDSEKAIETVFQKYAGTEKAACALEYTRKYWQNQVNVAFHTGNQEYDLLMKWVCFQPILRRLFGCSFLPHHDYGRGGRGWRDLWQDCLSLLLMEPQDVGRMIEANFSGVRVDGTNATIIGEGDGNFIADRNGIPRVWMDHALWPLKTTKLYLDQTGDLQLLLREIPYFKDSLTARGMRTDEKWSPADGNLLRTGTGEVYRGTILEHLIIQQLTAFYDVGDHNIYRLRDADWNDALDMASRRGESVAFTCAYAGNLMELVEMIRALDKVSPDHMAELLEEAEPLLQGDGSLYDNVKEKRRLLAEYTERCAHTVSGKRIKVSLPALAVSLLEKAQRQMEYIRENEWLEGPDGTGWFNSYYDDHGQAVEGVHDGQVRMMLTGQVFAVMGGVASNGQVKQIVESADKYLYRPEIGGYRLNTDFQELKLDMGRMFGFAYGEKENGAVFSHMTVMYANALYRRGFVKEGAKALQALSDAALNFSVSHIYPGIPEYFRSDGRGMYHYLTGAASWFMLTMITEVFGVRGAMGDLVFHPKLLAEQFDKNGVASIEVPFAGQRFMVTYENRERKSFGEYSIGSAVCDGVPLSIVEESYALLPRSECKALSGQEHRIHMILV